MSKPQQTGRKSRHKRLPSNRIPAVSDYDSDMAAMQSANDYEPPMAIRTEGQMNLDVLRRYLPSVRHILHVSPQVVVYTTPDRRGWEKSDIEGPMFVCMQDPLPEDPGQRKRACVIILSRKNLQNLTFDLARVSDMEVNDGSNLLFLQVEASWEGQESQVFGLFFHEDEENTRSMAIAMIEETRKVAREAGPAAPPPPGPEPTSEVGPAMEAMGSGQLTIDDLFRSQNGSRAMQ